LWKFRKRQVAPDDGSNMLEALVETMKDVENKDLVVNG
jgi:hypothetical protein